MDANTASGEAAGIPAERFAQLNDYATSPAFSEAERLALRYADGMTIGGQDISDEMFADVRRLFSEEEVVELTAHVAFENFRSKFNHALRIEAQGFCRVGRRGEDLAGQAALRTHAGREVDSGSGA